MDNKLPHAINSTVTGEEGGVKGSDEFKVQYLISVKKLGWWLLTKKSK